MEHVDPAVTSRIAGVDLNPAFRQRLLELFPNPHFALDLTCADLAAHAFEYEAFDLVHAGLGLEPRRSEPAGSGKAFDVLRLVKPGVPGRK